MTTEVDCFVDGYNLWHAIVVLGRPDLKWLSLRDLARLLLGPDEVLVNVSYYSAIATYKSPESIRRIRGGVPVRPITPPGRYVSNRLQQVSGRKRATKLSIRHLERSQLPDEVRDPETGRVAARRPAKWR